MLIIKPTNLKIKELQEINLYNWQFIQPLENNIKIIVMYRIFVINNLDLITFHTLNNPKEKVYLELYVEYIQNVLVCRKCVFGTLDWIESVRGAKEIENRQMQKLHRDRNFYKRDQTYVTKFIDSDTGTYCYLSSSKIEKGIERCKYCYGSGILFEDLNIHRNLAIVSA